MVKAREQDFFHDTLFFNSTSAAQTITKFNKSQAPFVLAKLFLPDINQWFALGGVL